MPSLDLTAAYTATGTGGTQFSYGSGFPPPILSQNARSFGSVLGDAFGGAYPSWTFGVVVRLPARASPVRKRPSRRTSSRSSSRSSACSSSRPQIVRQVREAAREVQTAYQRVQASEAAMQATQQQLDAEQRRFEVGLASSFEVQQNQRDLASARLNKLQAKIAYNRALISAERGAEDRTVTRSEFDGFDGFDGF